MGQNEALYNLPLSKSWGHPSQTLDTSQDWIEPPVNNPDYVFATIKAGALGQSHDGGKSWIERVRARTIRYNH